MQRWEHPRDRVCKARSRRRRRTTAVGPSLTAIPMEEGHPSSISCNATGVPRRVPALARMADGSISGVWQRRAEPETSGGPSGRAGGLWSLTEPLLRSGSLQCEGRPPSLMVVVTGGGGGGWHHQASRTMARQTPPISNVPRTANGSSTTHPLRAVSHFLAVRLAVHLGNGVAAGERWQGRAGQLEAGPTSSPLETVEERRNRAGRARRALQAMRGQEMPHD